MDRKSLNVLELFELHANGARMCGPTGEAKLFNRINILLDFLAEAL